MRVWTNGTFARVWVNDTIYRLRRGSLSIEEKVKGVKGATATRPDEVVAWGPGGARLDSALEAKRRKVVDAVALDDARVAAVLVEGKAAPKLVIGPPAGPFEAEIELSAQAEKVAWPDGVWASGAAPWSKSPRFEGVGARGIRVHANEHGVGVAAASSGHVAVVRPGGAALSFVHRVPGQEESRLDAVPTRRGVLVTLVVEGREGAVVHIGEDGSILGRWPDGAARSCFPALRLSDDHVLAFDQESEAVALLSLPDLSELTREAISDPIVEAAADPKGGFVVLADGANIYEIRVEEESLSLDGPFDLSEAKKQPEPEETAAVSSYEPARSLGNPQIAFPTEKQPADPPWTIAPAGELRMKMRVRSAGKASRGVMVEVGGAAVIDGLVAGGLARVGALEAELVKDGPVIRATFPDVDVPQGIEYPYDPKPDNENAKLRARALMSETHFTVEVVVIGAKAGNGLLSVAISVPKSAAAPLKRIRPFTVS